MTPNIELRDYFAGQCLAGMLANPEFVKASVKQRKGLEKEFGLSAESFAKSNQQWHTEVCYQFADLMLAEREKQPTEQSS